MTTATIEDTEITQLWGDRKAFVQRMVEYEARTGAKVGFVIPLGNNNILNVNVGPECY